MWREIRLGLHAGGEAAEGWARVLQQDRLPWEMVDGPSQPMIIFDGMLPSWSIAFIEGGGVAVITGAPRAENLLGPSTTVTLNRFRPPRRDRDASMPCLARVFDGQGEGQIRLHENRKPRGGRLADVRAAVLTRQHGRGWIIFTGLPLAQHLTAEGDSLRAFTDVSNITERVATVDKAEVADTMTWMIAQAFSKRQLPFIRIARYPFAARSVFLFRVDADGLFGQNCRTLAEIAEAHGIHASFYFNRSLCRTSPGELSRDWLETHEIGHHADIHDLFDSADENRANLQTGMDWLEQQAGIRTTGYVAPRGLWNNALDQAMADLGHVYSSDFGLDFDSLPFFTPAGVLQIPVHPFSPERYTIYQEDAGLGPPSGNAVLNHYLSALTRQVSLRRPAHVYGHPEVLGGMADSVLPQLFQAVAHLAIPNMTLGAFADWWLARNESNLTVLLDSESSAIVIETTNKAVEVYDVGRRHIKVNGRGQELDRSGWTVISDAGEVQL